MVNCIGASIPALYTGTHRGPCRTCAAKPLHLRMVVVFARAENTNCETSVAFMTHSLSKNTKNSVTLQQYTREPWRSRGRGAQNT